MSRTASRAEAVLYYGVDQMVDDTGTCSRCRHVAIMIALGLGVQCMHPANTQANGKNFRIPKLTYSCEHFEPREPQRA